MIGPKEYAQVLKEALAGKTLEEQKLMVEGFLVALSTRGQQKILPRIVSELERRHREQKEKIVITFARKEDRLELSDHIHEDLKQLEREDDENQIEKEDISLIGGYRIETEECLIDRSHKKALYDLYQKLIT